MLLMMYVFVLSRIFLVLKLFGWLSLATFEITENCYFFEPPCTKVPCPICSSWLFL